MRLLGSLAIVAALAAGPAAAATIGPTATSDTVAERRGVHVAGSLITAANDNVASGSRSGECTPPAAYVGARGRRARTSSTAPSPRQGGRGVPTAAGHACRVIVETVFIDGYSQGGSDAEHQAQQRQRRRAHAGSARRHDGVGLRPDGPVARSRGGFQFIGPGASGRPPPPAFAIGGFRAAVFHVAPSGVNPAAVVIHRAGGVQIGRRGCVGLGAGGQRGWRRRPESRRDERGAFETLYPRKGTRRERSNRPSDRGAGNLIGGPEPPERSVIGTRPWSARVLARPADNAIASRAAPSGSLARRAAAFRAEPFRCRRRISDAASRRRLAAGQSHFTTTREATTPSAGFWPALARPASSPRRTGNCAAEEARGEQEPRGEPRHGARPRRRLGAPSGFRLGARPGCSTSSTPGARSRPALPTTRSRSTPRGWWRSRPSARPCPPSAANDIHANSIFSNVGSRHRSGERRGHRQRSGDGDAGRERAATATSLERLAWPRPSEDYAAIPAGQRARRRSPHRASCGTRAAIPPSQGDGQKYLGRHLRNPHRCVTAGHSFPARSCPACRTGRHHVHRHCDQRGRRVPIRVLPVRDGPGGIRSPRSRVRSSR